MSKYTPIRLTQLSANEFAAVDTINKNLEAIKESIDDSISRSAKSPSQMAANLDMNGQKILNIGSPTSETDLVRMKDVAETKAEIQTLVNTAATAVDRALEGVATIDGKVIDAADNAALAARWATKMDGPVADGEYSSKYYAENIGANVNTVADHIANVDAVVEDISNIDAVASNQTNIDAVVENATNINAVAANKTDIDTVATNVADVNTCAANMAAIQDAPNQAQAAADSAALAYQYGNDKINQTHIANCLTEIPQDIKLELSSGTLTLKSGSKVYVPNGSGVFDAVTISSDVSSSSPGSATGQKFVFRTGSNSLAFYLTSKCISAASNPGSGYQLWYNTSENKIYVDNTSTGNFSVSTFSLPFVIATITTGPTISSIEQIFNGFGYIGSTVFALPGIKGLIPNGRNEDGTLKNITISLSSVKTGSRNLTGSNVPVWLRDNGNITFSSGVYYDEKTNLIANTTDKFLQFATADMTSGVISNFTSKSAFHAADYYDLKKIDEGAVKLTGNQTVAGDKTFSGSVNLGSNATATTPSSATDNSTKIATTAWVNNARAMITGWGMPDYSAGVSKTDGATAPSKGWAVAYGHNANVTLKVNNVQVAQGNWDANDWSGNWNMQIMVDTGDKVTGAAWTFYPCKGG